jgi:hypothetical protein
VAALVSLLLLVGALVGGFYVLNLPKEEPEASLRSLKQLDREVAGGARVSRPEWGTAPTLSFDSFRVVKPKLFGFSLGGFNLIEIDNLRVVLTEGLLQKPSNLQEGEKTEAGFLALSDVCSVRALKRAVGVGKKVSGLKISGLSFCASDSDGTLTEILFAKAAKSVDSNRILLKECGFLDENLILHQVPEAEMDVKDGVITTGSQLVSLELVAKKLIGEEQ